MGIARVAPYKSGTTGGRNDKEKRISGAWSGNSRRDARQRGSGGRADKRGAWHGDVGGGTFGHRQGRRAGTDVLCRSRNAPAGGARTEGFGAGQGSDRLVEGERLLHAGHRGPGPLSRGKRPPS